MEKDLLKISLRQQRVFVSKRFHSKKSAQLNHQTMMVVDEVAKLGFAFSENLLHVINGLPPRLQFDILEGIRNLTGVKKNWTPLNKTWQTEEHKGKGLFNRVKTWFKKEEGWHLECGHHIPKRIFPLSKYNGCPFCGEPLTFSDIEHIGQNKSLKVLDLWTEVDLENQLNDLLTSKTALDATQADSLKGILTHFPLPSNITISIKETLIVVIDALIASGRGKEAAVLFTNPQDILRYLWYKHTGFMQIVKPKIIVNKNRANSRHIFGPADGSALAVLNSKAQLKLKYSRSMCKMVAFWMNSLKLSPQKVCEIMHPHRGMWVRFIRALRLAEYSKKAEFKKLAVLLDVFYREDYTVWQGQVDINRLKCDADKTFALLKKRPGMFARSLFSNMLWFGEEETLKHFREVLDQIPTRLVITLSMYAQNYFERGGFRTIKPLGGNQKNISKNRMLELFSQDQLNQMKASVETLCLESVERRFSGIETSNKTMYIEPTLFQIPLSIGDRSDTVQDLPSALMGTRFPIEGKSIRLFMQWGEGLPAQHLDMDLSCKVAYEDRTMICSYSSLNILGCKHSGDIQYIPNKIGTAEYIDVDVDTLREKGAKYVSFTCNAYTNGHLSPNMMVGWMDSKHPMKVSSKTGVAFDPSCVQHMVRVTQNITKGLVFGVLDVVEREVIWLEMSFGGQVVQNLDLNNVEALLAKLDSKMTVGRLLEIKAQAQNLELVKTDAFADEIYDRNWVQNTAAVTQLLVD